jgi:dynein intermediate chain 1
LTPRTLLSPPFLCRVITANNPQAPNNLVIYNFVDKEYKPMPATADEHCSFHFILNGSVLHTGSDAFAEQKAYEREFKARTDEKRRERQRLAAEEGKDVSGLDMDDDLQRNQFNFTERAAQTYNPSMKTRVIGTIPPESTDGHGQMTQWALYDAYLSEYERLVYQMNMEKAAKEVKGGKEKDKGGRKSTDPMHSPEMGKTLAVLERMVNANAEDEIYSDFKYWEDASDSFREGAGTCLPLWKFEDATTKRKMVTAVAWNPAHPDLFAVGYGSYDFMKQGSGLVRIYSLKNVGHYEYFFNFDSGVMCLDFHPTNPCLLAVGCYDGTVKVFDIRRKETRFAADIRSGKHTDPVWEVRWSADDGAGKDLSFYSVSSDGKVAQWIMTKSELKMETAMTLKLVGGGASERPIADAAAMASAEGEAAATATVPSAAAASAPSATSSAASNGPEEESRLSGLAGGCCFAFNPFQESMFLVGTEEGKIHKCSLEYTGQYMATYEGHDMAVYALRWNPFHPRVFLSCSADWTVKLWDHTHPTAIMSFDLGTPVGDIAWAPFSSTVFSAVTDEGKVCVWDLYVNKHEQMCEQKVRAHTARTNRRFHSLSA